jgi:putative methyltransferase
MALRRRSFCLDEHIPNLIAFPVSSLNLPKFEPYRDSRFIAQDKASCMPAFLLLQGLTRTSSGTDEVVIDATSAPGNKTSYAAATLCRFGRGQVYAFERDSKRYSLLRQMLSKAGCKSECEAACAINGSDEASFQT